MPKPLDVQVGDRFGRWVVLAQAPSNGHGRRYECLCDPEVGGCGSRGEVVGRYLVNGDSRSCGCLKRELAKKAATKHGLVGHELWHVWRGMVGRCTSLNNPNWSRYGGRGIQVCERWRSVENFVADMHPRPEGFQLHRINNDLGYSPENCEWVARGKHQQGHMQTRLQTDRRIRELDSELRRLRTLVAGGLVPTKLHEDERGWIRDVTTESWDSATRIVTYKGKVRGNHYHKATWQLTIVADGCLKVITETDEMRREFLLQTGEMMMSPPNERHAWKALADTTVVVLTRGPRSGDRYEDDTHRLAEPLIA